MFKTQCVFAFLVLYVGLAHAFSWDIVLARAGRLEFYNEGTLTNSIKLVRFIELITYDPVNNRVLLTMKYHRNDSVSSFDIATMKTQSLIKKKPNRFIHNLCYDPATELLFWTTNRIVYSFSIKPGYDSEANEDVVINLEEEKWPRYIAVDSCGGYIYWITGYYYVIERARFNGSEREVVLDGEATTYRDGLAIDQQAQRMYWIGSEENYVDDFSIESADLNGNDRKSLYSEKDSKSNPEKLTISKDFVSWADTAEKSFWQLPKNLPRGIDVQPKKNSLLSSFFHGSREWTRGSQDIAANYTIEEQTQGVQNCKALKRLLPNYAETSDQDALNASTDVSLFCENGTKVSGESRCECTPGYIGTRCDVSVCQNYCLQGDCSVSAEGQPKCRCYPGYFEERCEVNACHGYCLNSGVCSLNKSSEPVCQCTGPYQGERCGVPVFCIKCFLTVSTLKDILNTDTTPVTRDKGLKSTCAATVV